VTYLNIARAAEDPDFNARIRAVLYKLSADVINEDPATDQHNARKKMAEGIRRFLSFDTARFAWVCASNPTVAAQITTAADGRVSVDCPDGDLEFLCSTVWTEMATQVWGQAH